MKQYRVILTRWLPFIVWLITIFIVSDQSSNSIPDYGYWDFLVKKGGHIFAYGVLAILARRLGVGDAGALAIVFAYAISDEVHQRFVPGRTGTAIDVLIDLLGAILSLAFLRLLPQHWREALLDQTDGIDEQSPHGV